MNRDQQRADHLRYKLDQRRAALALIEERISEYVEREAVPLDLIRNQRAVKDEIAELERELESLLRTPRDADPLSMRTQRTRRTVALLHRLDRFRFGRWPMGRTLVFALALVGQLVGWIYLGFLVWVLAGSVNDGQELVLFVLFTVVSGVFVFIGISADRVLLTAPSPGLAFTARLLSPVAVFGLALWLFLTS